MIRRRSGAIAALVTFIVLAVPGAGPLAAQDDGDVQVFSSSGRPRIGVMLDSHADKDQDKIGARVESIMPDGPADRAGLKAGDIITKFNGTALGGIAAEDEDASGPAEKLVDLAGKLAPGDTVTVEYRRGTETRTAKIVARELPGRETRRSFRMAMPGVPGIGDDDDFSPMLRNGRPGFDMIFGGEAGGLALTELNPDLGEYFGAKEGILVLKTPRDSTLPLKAGDVILAIDGRTPTSAAHAQRILRSYDAGETAKLDILRKQKKLTVVWKVPARDWKWRQSGPKEIERVKVERS